MKRMFIALTLTIVTLALLPAGANAAGPFQKWRASVGPNRHDGPKMTRGGLYRVFPSYSPYHSVDDAYPRYIGAFHSRYFNDLGIPSGDVGIRANTVQMLPW